MESSLQQPSTASSEISLTYIGGVFAAFALLWVLGWIFNSFRRQHDRVHLHNQPHFFWIPRKK